MYPNNKVDMSIIKGDDIDYDVTFTTGTTALDLTGSTVYFTVHKKAYTGVGDVIISKTITNHTEPLNGKTASIS